MYIPNIYNCPQKRSNSHIEGYWLKAATLAGEGRGHL
jgi:hypothetical protein